MIYVLLPSYNEEKGLLELLPRLPQLFGGQGESYKVVVVDDGSQDRTRDVACSFLDTLPIEVISFRENQGVGEVFQTGFQYVCEDSQNPEEDICISFDADNTQDPIKIFEMAAKIREGEDVVIASRFEGDGHMVGCPWHRALYSWGVSWLLRTLTGLPGVKDYSIFYRAYRVSLLQKGFERYGNHLIEGRGFAVKASLLLKLSNLTQRIVEIPNVLRYDLKEGASGNKIIKTIHGYLQLIGDYLKTNKYNNLPFEPLSSSPERVPVS